MAGFTSGTTSERPSFLFFRVFPPCFSRPGSSVPLNAPDRSRKRRLIRSPPVGAAVSTLTNELATAREALEAESSSRAELALQLRQSHEAVTDYEAEKAELIAAREKLSGESESLRKRIGALIAEQQTLRAELSKTSASDSTSLKNEVARLKKQIESERKKTAKRRKPASPQRLKRFKRELIRPSTGISSNPSAIFPRSTFHSSSMIPSNWIGNSVLPSSNSAA